jgi:hypothetical protein
MSSRREGRDGERLVGGTAGIRVFGGPNAKILMESPGTRAYCPVPGGLGYSTLFAGMFVSVNPRPDIEDRIAGRCFW